MSVSRMLPSILFFLILSVWQVGAEEKCKCVDYDRDWYVIVTSFTSGLILSAILAFILKYYFQHCGRVRTPTHTVESQETLETRTEGGVDQLYEEVPGVENSGFETSESFKQALRSDSKTNLVVDVSLHCEPTAKYQHPRFEMKPICIDYGTTEDKSNGQTGTNKNDGIPQSDYQHLSSDYHYPEPNYTNMDVRVQETNLTSESKVDDYQQPTKFTPPKPPRNFKSSLSPSERYKKLPIKNSKTLTNSQTPLEHVVQTNYTASSPKLVPLSPPSRHATDDKNKKDYHPCLDTDITFLEGGEQNREGEAAAFIAKQSSGQNLRTVAKSQPPSPNSVINEKSNCEAGYQKPEIDAEFPENEGVNKQQPTPGMRHVESDCEAGYQVPETDKEFLENEGVNKLQPIPSISHVESDREAGYRVPEIDAEFSENERANKLQPTLGISHVESDREAGYQVPEIDAEFLENEACNASHPPSSLGNAKKNRETGQQVSEIDTRFFECGDKSLIQPPPALPLRRPSQNSSSTSLVDLPSKTPALQTSPFGRPTTASPPVPSLPSKASQKSPSVTPSVVATSSPSLTLPVEAPSVKSPKIVPSKSVKSPQLLPKAAPPLPAKTKPVSSPPFYAELNELDMEDDAENYQHLTPTNKQ